MTSNMTLLRKDMKSAKVDSPSRRSFGKGLLVSGLSFGLAPLVFSNVAAASAEPEAVSAPANKLRALIQEQLQSYLGEVEADGNALEKVRNDDGFHSLLGLQLM